MPMPPAYNLVAIIGPTASGKTLLAATLADILQSDVISADSRQVYRGMNLGTGKDYHDYVIDGRPVKYHLVDIADPGYKYSLFEFQRDFYRVFAEITSQGKLPVLCGGSGLYIESALKGYFLPEVPINEELRSSLAGKDLDGLSEMLSSMKKLHNKTDIDTRERALRAIEIEVFMRDKPPAGPLPVIKPLVIAVCYERETERKRITERLQARLEAGMMDEVKQLMESGVSQEALEYYGLEYRFISRYLAGMIRKDEMIRLLNTAIHQFAKRQRTFLRKMEKDGLRIHWMQGELPTSEKVKEILSLLQ
jgi:tRNA dimethylallyltransferase